METAARWAGGAVTWTRCTASFEKAPTVDACPPWSLYTPVGLSAQVTAAAHDASSGRSVVTKTYNGRGQVLTSQVTGVPAPTVSHYDIFGEVTQTVDPKGNPTKFTYYPTGHLQTTTYPNQTTTTQVADNVGNITSVTQPTGSGARRRSPRRASPSSHRSRESRLRTSGRRPARGRSSPSRA